MLALLSVQLKGMQFSWLGFVVHRNSLNDCHTHCLLPAEGVRNLSQDIVAECFLNPYVMYK